MIAPASGRKVLESSHPLASHELQLNAETTKPLKVLVVDDDPATLKLVRNLLEGRGHQVSTRQEPIGTTAQARIEQPDCVLLDVVMPALSGERVAQILNRDHNLEHTRIIFLSTRPPEELEDLTNKTSADGWIHKDADHEKFLEQFEQLAIGSSHSRAQ